MEHYVKVSIIKDSNIVFIEDLFNFALQPKTTYFVFKKNFLALITLHNSQEQ